MRHLIILITSLALFVSSSAFGDGAQKNGWWIKIKKERQESPAITFSLGSNNQTVEAWKTWGSGQPLEFDLPDKFREIDSFYIKAQSSAGRNSWFCLMYQGAGVKHFDFNDEQENEVKHSDQDVGCSFINK